MKCPRVNQGGWVTKFLSPLSAKRMSNEPFPHHQRQGKYLSVKYCVPFPLFLCLNISFGNWSFFLNIFLSLNININKGIKLPIAWDYMIAEFDCRVNLSAILSFPSWVLWKLTQEALKLCIFGFFLLLLFYGCILFILPAILLLLLLLNHQHHP